MIQPTFPTSVPLLSSDRVRLREPAEHDIPAWFERATDTESAFLAGDPVPDSIERGADWLERHRSRFRSRTGIRWVIDAVGGAASAGSIGLSMVPGEQGMAALGFVIGRSHWGQGLASAAGRLVVPYALATLRLVRLQADLLASNEASRRVLDKLGFRLERSLPDFDRVDGHPVEGCRYVLHA